MARTFKWKNYTEYKCKCGKPASPAAYARKDGTKAPTILNEKPACNSCVRKDRKSRVIEPRVQKHGNYTKYKCKCGKKASPAGGKRKDGTRAPKTINGVPSCRSCYNEYLYSHVPGGYNEAMRKKRSHAKRKNWELLTEIFYGGSIPFQNRYCLFSGNLIYRKKLAGKEFSNMAVLHHMLVEGKASTHKRGKEPSDVLLQASLSKEDITEFMGTIVINQDYHSYVHDHGNELDFRMFSREQLPFILRSPQKFNQFVRKHKLDLKYQAFLKTLTNPNMPEELIHEDWA